MGVGGQKRPEPEPAAPRDAAPAVEKPPRPRRQDRFTRRQLAVRAVLAAGGLILVQAAVAFCAQGMWRPAAGLPLCPLLWVFAWGMAVGTAEFWAENDLRRARRVSAHYAGTEPDPEEAGRQVEVYRLPADGGRELLWRRSSGNAAGRAALPVRRVWRWPGGDGDRAESTGWFLFVLLSGLVLAGLTLGAALLGAGAVAFCLAGPWVL
jgi:hypothetical protein